MWLNEDYWGRSLSRIIRWSLNAITCILWESVWVLRQIHRREHNTHRRGKGSVTTEAETGVIKPESRFAPRASIKECEHAGLQNYERISVVLSNPLFCKDSGRRESWETPARNPLKNKQFLTVFCITTNKKRGIIVSHILTHVFSLPY